MRVSRDSTGWFSCAALGVTLALGHAAAVQAAPYSVTMTVDNSYALFTGTLTSATTFVGSDGSWPSAETYNFDLGSNAYIYVVTASDQSVAQGFLGQFTNTNTGVRFYSHETAWQVMATGLGGANAPYTGSAQNIALLSQEIVDANGGGNLSNGWVGLTAAGSNGVGPWGPIGGIDAAARWTWYSGGNCNAANPTQGGCNAGEWLVFRIAVAATPDNPVPNPSGPPTGNVPLPGTLALLGLGLVAARMTRRR